MKIKRYNKKLEPICSSFDYFIIFTGKQKNVHGEFGFHDGEWEGNLLSSLASLIVDFDSSACM